MKPFSEQMLYDYPLTPDSTILEIGGYHGKWAREMHRRYGCKVWIFEPCFEFFKTLYAEFAGNPRIRLHHLGVTGYEWRLATLKIKGDMTGLFAEGPEEIVALMPINFINTGGFDLIQINCEGSEYEILEKFSQPSKFLQVQFHSAGEKHPRKEYIEWVSAMYREHVYDDASGWSVWRK